MGGVAVDNGRASGVGGVAVDDGRASEVGGVAADDGPRFHNSLKPQINDKNMKIHINPSLAAPEITAGPRLNLISPDTILVRKTINKAKNAKSGNAKSAAQWCSTTSSSAYSLIPVFNFPFKFIIYRNVMISTEAVININIKAQKKVNTI